MTAVERIKAEVEAEMAAERSELCVERFAENISKCTTAEQMQEQFGIDCSHLTGWYHERAVDVYLNGLRRLGKVWALE